MTALDAYIGVMSSICLLPLLDGQQTTEIITAIEGKFPGLSEGWRKNSPWGNSVQTILSR